MDKKPKWSVMIPTYNCAQYTAQTIKSVLAQDLVEELMQIEVIDDCSSDNIEDVVKEIGGGRIKFFRQDNNVGHVKNFETALDRAQGEFVHLLHGDDYVLPGFYKAMTNMYNTYPEIGACYCRHFFVDKENNITHISELSQKKNSVINNFHRELIHGQKIQTPSITVKKEVYKKLGYFNKSLSWSEDWEMWVRISSKYPIGYIKEPLAAYRMHNNSSTGTKSITGENVNDLYRIKAIFKKYVQSDDELVELNKSFKKNIFNISRRNYEASKAIGHKEAYKHILTMAENSNNWKTSFILYINYWIKKTWK